MSSEPTKRRSLVVNLLLWVLALTVLVVVFISIAVLSENAETEQSSETVVVPLPTVTVTRLQLTDHAVRLTALSRLSPKHRSEISSIVEGRVTFLSPQFLIGAEVSKGDVLAVIDPVLYKAQHADAAHALANAKVERDMERREAQQAQEEWKVFTEQGRNIAEPSRLYFRQPQAEAAELAVEAATRNLEHTVAQVSAATIRAPFNAMVVERNVSPGEFVTPGQVVTTLESNDNFEIATQLTEQQWKMLDMKKMQLPINVMDVASDTSWRALVRSAGRLLDERTQMRTVYLTLHDLEPNTRIVGGQFVNVEFPGRMVTDVLVVPESAYTRDAAIWTIDDDDRLRKHAVSLVAAEDENVIIERPLDAIESYRVVVNPQARFTVGTRINPVEIESSALEGDS